jgi:hypothetical protein
LKVIDRTDLSRPRFTVPRSLAALAGAADLLLAVAAPAQAAMPDGLAAHSGLVQGSLPACVG